MTTFAIEHWCGLKFGGWRRGLDRFPTMARAEAESADIKRRAAQAKATDHRRRIVAAGG